MKSTSKEMPKKSRLELLKVFLIAAGDKTSRDKRIRKGYLFSIQQQEISVSFGSPEFAGSVEMKVGETTYQVKFQKGFGGQHLSRHRLLAGNLTKMWLDPLWWAPFRYILGLHKVANIPFLIL